MKARVIYNPSAGMRTAREQLEAAATELHGRGWSLDMVETVRPGQAVEFARQAAERMFDAVIAVGGDGTLNEAANGLVDSTTALGVLPLGTVNVWAKEMGLPPDDLRLGARLLADAPVRRIDVGEVCGPTIARRVFVLCCGVGLDAAITREVEPQRETKRRFGALLYWLVGIRRAWSYRGKPATLEFDDRRVRRRVILALAANTQLYGGIVRIAPDARVDDGALDLVVFRGTGVLATASHLLRVLVGSHLRDPQVEVYRTRCVQIKGKNLPVHVDAEPVGFTPLEIRVRPRALRVLVPKTANARLFGG
ncbi:MAG: diacylglycerol kinase family lipid kinase [Chloroflexi bacterium]|nr:diacylglycerol kinase family lipid kinase [Chloroflexota bacterium]